MELQDLTSEDLEYIPPSEIDYSLPSDFLARHSPEVRGSGYPPLNGASVQVWGKNVIFFSFFGFFTYILLLGC
jgi:hypothetical protein